MFWTKKNMFVINHCIEELFPLLNYRPTHFFEILFIIIMYFHYVKLWNLSLSWRLRCVAWIQLSLSPGPGGALARSLSLSLFRSPSNLSSVEWVKVFENNKKYFIQIFIVAKNYINNSINLFVCLFNLYFVESLFRAWLFFIRNIKHISSTEIKT